ncbi:permease prefix domain 1-containing protein [Paenibacillus sp. CMAA1364]
MIRLHQHVDYLFSKYKDNKQTNELKYEITSNLEAKVSDLIANGMLEDQAITIAIDHMDSIDGLIDSNPQVYVHRLQLELVQIALIYILIGWILTIPLGIIGTTTLFNLSMMVLVILCGVVFLLLHSNKNAPWMNKVTTLSIEYFQRYRRIAWTVWGLFMIATFMTNVALRFGSHIWFMRSIHINGPYQFAVIIIPFLLPLFSIIIPLLFNKAITLMYKYEVGDVYEK